MMLTPITPISSAPSLAHLERLTDDVGIVQHATYDIPNRSTGYCTDDVARALMVAIDAQRQGQLEAERLEVVYLAFLFDAQLEDGQFHNFMGYDRRWLDELSTEDAMGRAIWALGYAERFAKTKTRRAISAYMLNRVPLKALLEAPLRSLSFSAIGLVHACIANPERRQEFGQSLQHISHRLLSEFAQNQKPDWVWFEPMLTYDNARLCEALLRIGALLNDDQCVQAGLQTLNFYHSVIIENDIFVPIGSEGWYYRGQHRSRSPQQPLEATAYIDAASIAYAITGNEMYQTSAQQAYEWFTGKNTIATSLIHDGGCGDGIDSDRVSHNMGAESTLAYLGSSYAMSVFGRL